jgi:hypothetical protein
MVSFIGCSYLPNGDILLYSILKEKILIIRGCEKANNPFRGLSRKSLSPLSPVNKSGRSWELLRFPGVFHLISSLFTFIF